MLGHQKRFLIEHKGGLEKWTSAVYGLSLSTQDFAATNSTTLGDRDKRDGRGATGAGGPLLREVRVNVKCKGAKRRIDKQPLLAHVDRIWSPRQGRSKNVKKRSSVKAAEKPAKRGKLAVAKVDQAVVAGTIPTTTGTAAEETVEDIVVDEHSDGATDAPGQGWNGLQGRSSLSLVPKRQPPPGGFSLAAEDRLGGSELTPLRSADPAAKAAEPGTSEPMMEIVMYVTAPPFPYGPAKWV